MANHSASVACTIALAICLAGNGLSCMPSSPVASLRDTSIEDGFRLYTLRPQGGVIHLRVAQADSSVTDVQVIQWVNAAAEAVSRYFGRFPLSEVAITVDRGGKGKIEEGVTNDRGIHIRLGRDAGARDLADDWVMTYEMFHLGFPYIDDQYIWLREGLASYLEPLARARRGILPVAQVWGQFVLGMPQGQPEPGDKGLDLTHTWGRTYWGGAMFCLQADLRIREQTGNAKSLDDAMRAILAQGGNVRAEWSLEKVLDIGDRATGTHVLRDLHEEMGRHPVTVDLDALWNRLGVSYRNEQVFFNDAAPQAAIRRSITASRR